MTYETQPIDDYAAAADALERVIESNKYHHRSYEGRAMPTKLYQDLPGYDRISRIEKAVDKALHRGADWFFARVENVLMVGAGLSIFAVALIVAAHAWSVK